MQFFSCIVPYTVNLGLQSSIGVVWLIFSIICRLTQQIIWSMCGASVVLMCFNEPREAYHINAIYNTHHKPKWYQKKKCFWRQQQHQMYMSMYTIITISIHSKTHFLRCMCVSLYIHINMPTYLHRFEFVCLVGICYLLLANSLWTPFIYSHKKVIAWSENRCVQSQCGIFFSSRNARM